MAVLPPGVGFTTPVAVAHVAVPGDPFHRFPTSQDHGSACGIGACELVPQSAAFAVGFGCRPCPQCWPQPAVTGLPDTPLLRPAAPWPSNGGGYYSRLHPNRSALVQPRPGVPA